MRYFSTVRLLLVLLLLLAVPAAPAAGDFDDLVLQTVVDDLDFPVDVGAAGDERLFIALINGRILVVENDEVRDEPFLDLSDRVHPAARKGLYGFAFAPDVDEHPVLFVAYTAPDFSHVVSRFTLADDGESADPASERILLQMPKETARHNAGQLAFGPDGYLYVTTGDGSTNVPDPQCASLSLDSLEGKILRLDVLSPLEAPQGDQPPHYVVPDDNPLIDEGAPEVWALGLRNPWRMSFDRESGDLWIADVGELELEEIDRQPASSPGGENYGWKTMEGTACFSDACGDAPACNSSEYTLPTLEYGHEEGRCSITGGYVYRGSAIPDLNGDYVYGDFCTGEIWAADVDDLEVETLPVRLPALASFGQDAAGEIYAIDETTLYRLIDLGETPTCVSDANHLCLLDGRFRVSADWRTSDGDGQARAVPFDDGLGAFWFFGPNNTEIFVKALDACSQPSQHFWIFVAGLTNVEVELTVFDTVAGVEKIYANDLGNPFTPIQDTRAFATCP